MFKNKPKEPANTVSRKLEPKANCKASSKTSIKRPRLNLRTDLISGIFQYLLNPQINRVFLPSKQIIRTLKLLSLKSYKASCPQLKYFDSLEKNKSMPK